MEKLGAAKALHPRTHPITVEKIADHRRFLYISSLASSLDSHRNFFCPHSLCFQKVYQFCTSLIAQTTEMASVSKDQVDGILNGFVLGKQLSIQEDHLSHPSRSLYRRMDSHTSRGGFSSRGGSRAGSRMQVGIQQMIRLWKRFFLVVPYAL